MLVKTVFIAFSFLLTTLLSNVVAIAQKRSAANTKPIALRSITLVTEPKALVWLDKVRRGTTDESGRLQIEKVSAGGHQLRVRALGFSEKAVNLPPTERGEVSISLVKTSDEAELAFQEAEILRESGGEANRQQAVQLYRQALKVKPNFLSARIGLARVLNDLDEFDAALEAIAATRKINPNSAEASTVEGRIYRSLEDPDNAIKSFRRAIREARNFEPEAHTGLALALNDKGQMESAVKEFQIALTQLSDTEPIVYQLLGETYEKMERHKEAIAAYEKFLQTAPKSSLVPGVRSIVEQLKKRDKNQTLELMPQ